MDLPLKTPKIMQPLINTYYSVIMKLHQLEIHIDNKKVQKILSSYFLDFVNQQNISIQNINEIFSMEI